MHRANCGCGTAMTWVECPTGGWWKHDFHPADDHDGDPGQGHSIHSVPEIGSFVFTITCDGLPVESIRFGEPTAARTQAWTRRVMNEHAAKPGHCGSRVDAPATA